MYPKLLDHLLARLKDVELYDSTEPTFTDAEQCSIVLDDDTIYQHKVLRVNYTTYDLPHNQDSINPRTHADVMVAAHEDESDEVPHPYWYARVIGIFHANVSQRGSNIPPKHMDFLWVRWFGRDLAHKGGWRVRRLYRIGFVESQDPTAFSFLDPASVIRAVHLIPAFSLGKTVAEVDPSHEDIDWQQYYVNMYVTSFKYLSSNLFISIRFVD